MTGAINMSIPSVTLTFGHYTQTGPWSDVRTMDWADFARLLTTHEIGRKEGTCFAPAIFNEARRDQNQVAQIEIVVLDSDAGHSLTEIATAVQRHGWAACISSTHSHGATRTQVKRAAWDRFLRIHGDKPDAAGAFLRGKGYLPAIADGAVIVEDGDEHLVLQHQPCPKFRIAIPLQRPWRAIDYGDQRNANAAWKLQVEALATTLGLQHDKACTDTSRLFYLPRRPVDGPKPETLVLSGAPCDIAGLPLASRPTPSAAPGTKGRRQRSAGVEAPSGSSDASGAKDFDLRAWARRYAGAFEIVTALRARRPDVFTGKVSDGTKHHLRCINESVHTRAGEDAATFVINSSESTTRGFVHHCRHAHCDGVDRLNFLRGMLDEGWLAVDDLTDPRFLVTKRIRPCIQITGGEIARIVDEAENALLEAELDIFQRGPFLVRPGNVMVRTARRGEVAARRIFEVEEHSIAEAMTRAADWEKYDARSDAWVRIDAPLRVAHTYRQRKGTWRLPVLTGLINAPTLRADGSILAEPGYDASTGLLLETEGRQFPAVPETPTWDEGREAISILLRLIETFPFVADADRAVAISAILTACIRRALPTAPLHAFTAPVMGSGKSKLVDIACLIATGRDAPVISQGKKEEEFEKRIGALLLAGETIIPIDNCETDLGGEFLCTVLTQVVARTRILGRSEAPELPTNALITATGNNLVLVGDMTRRAVICRLDPGCERPELRTFAVDPIAQVRKNRPTYLIAALTALRAYFAAGCPKQTDPLGSFERWSRIVRDALVWLGLADPVETMESLRVGDPQLDALSAVMTHWAVVIGTRKVGVREIIDAATEQQSGVGQGGLLIGRPAFRHPDFREALLAVAGDGGVINNRRLGKWLGAQQSRIVEGRRFSRAGLSGGNMQWQLEEVGTDRRSVA